MERCWERTRAQGYTIAEMAVGTAVAGVLFLVATTMVSATQEGHAALSKETRSARHRRATFDELRCALQASGWSSIAIDDARFGHALEFQQVVGHEGGSPQWGAMVERLGVHVSSDDVLPTCGDPVFSSLGVEGQATNIRNGGVFGDVLDEVEALNLSALLESDAEAAADLEEQADNASHKVHWTAVFGVLESERDGEMRRDLYRLLLGPSGKVRAVERVLDDVEGFKAQRAGNACELFFYRRGASEPETYLVIPRN